MPAGVANAACTIRSSPFRSFKEMLIPSELGETEYMTSWVEGGDTVRGLVFNWRMVTMVYQM